jgi:hypothetical protein
MRRKLIRKGFLDREVHVSRGTVYVFAGIVVLFFLSSTVSKYFPNDIANMVLAVLALPPVLLLAFVGMMLGAPLQSFIDLFFVFVAAPYWFGILVVIMRAYSIAKNVVFIKLKDKLRHAVVFGTKIRL